MTVGINRTIAVTEAALIKQPALMGAKVAAAMRRAAIARLAHPVAPRRCHAAILARSTATVGTQ